MNSLLISVNVGLPRDVSWQGKIVRTAIWKRPVVGRVMARRLNLDGDGQGDLAGHGGEHRAVMVYQMGSYRYWQEHLNRQDFEYGQFGENLTVDGLADDEVCIGDRYRVGTALFEVTQPRVTCYRVGIRMNNPEMPALLVSHKRPGFYFRVIEEGEIGAGDEIVKVADGPESMRVSEVDALLYLAGHSPDQLRRALRIPSLSQGWRSSFEALLQTKAPAEHVGLATPTSSPAWDGFRPLRVVEVQRECEGVLSFTLADQNDALLPNPLAGQFLVFKIEVPGSPAPVLRSYSLSGPPNSSTYRISVKLQEGPGSRFFHDRVRPGDLLQVSAPRGGFTLVASERPVVFLSAGIGATPVLAMLHALKAATGSSTREVWWCYGTRNRREHPFAGEVHGVLRGLLRGRAVTFYSKPDSGDRLGEDYDAIGHLNLFVLQALGMPRTADYYICGPPAFLAEVLRGLKAWNISDDQIHSETFGSVPSATPGIQAGSSLASHPPPGEIGDGPTISFTRTGLSVPWDDRFGSILELAEACDVRVRWSCRTGVCHTCATGVIAGSFQYEPKPLDPPSESNVLICCAKPLSQIELDL